MALAVHEERAAEDEAHFLLQRALEQLAVVDARHPDPEEEPAAGRGPLHTAVKVRLKRLLHHRALRLVVGAEVRGYAIDRAAGQRGVDDPLVEHAARNVRGLLA